MKPVPVTTPQRDQYLHRLISTHLRSGELRRYVDLPANLGGQWLLDIGAGTSTASMDFGADGARVVALDLRFRDPDEVSRSSGDYFKGFRSNLDDPVLKRQNPRLVQVYEEAREDASRFFRDFARGAKGFYVAGDLWSLPFADDYFDQVFSVRCLADCYVDADFFLAAAREALRVARPGSMVQISPWQADYLSLGRGLPVGASARQQEAVLSALRSAGVAYECTAVRHSDVQCLRLLKPL